MLYLIEKYETNNQNFDNYYYIETINFCDNNLTEASLLPLILYLRKQPNIKDIGLSNNQWNDEVITYFSMSLSFWSNLQALYLSSTYIYYLLASLFLSFFISKFHYLLLFLYLFISLFIFIFDLFIIILYRIKRC